MIDTNAIRKRVLDLAIQGKLTIQNDNESSVDDIYKIKIEKERLVADKIIKKPAILKPISEEEKVFEIPSNWSWIRLDELCKMITDGTHKTPNYQNEGVPFLSVKNISSGKFDLSDIKYISTEEHQELIKRCNPEKNDILVCRIGTLGKAITISIDLEFSIFVSLGLLKPVYKSLSEYIVRVINSGYGIEWIQENKAGGAMHTYKINLDSLRMLPVPFPPISEQCEIVARVDEIFKQLDIIDGLQQKYAIDIDILKGKLIDAGIQGKLTEQLPEDGTAEELYTNIQEEKTKLIKEKKIKKEKTLAELSEEEIPFEIPTNWKWVRLGDVCSKISSGNTPAGGSKGGAYTTEGFCFFREQNIYNDGIHNDGMVYITEELLNTRENSTVLPKDILLNITGGSIGRCALIPDDFSRGSINQHILIIRVVDPRTRFYVHKCLCSPYYQRLIMGNVVGDKDGFSAGRCKNTLIPLPPIAEQKRIVDKIDELLFLI